MTSTKRPLGVTILAILNFLGAATESMLLLLAVSAPDTLRSLLAGLSPQGSGPDALLNMGTGLALYFVAIIALMLVLGYGLWTLRNWARIITIIITAISLLGTLIGFVQIGAEIGLSAVLLGLLRVGLCILILWYLFKPNVREAFRKRVSESI